MSDDMAECIFTLLNAFFHSCLPLVSVTGVLGIAVSKEDTCEIGLLGSEAVLEIASDIRCGSEGFAREGRLPPSISSFSSTSPLCIGRLELVRLMDALAART